jgi:alkylated DNA nucleotide flippase Atl1
MLRKSWRERLIDDKDLPKVIEIDDKMSQRWGTGTVVIPAPRKVDDLMKQVPRGQVITTAQIRAALARRHNASIGCPITTGIFCGIAARAAEEAAAENEPDITPYWRTLKPGGELNEKYPGGPEAQAARLRKEGHTIEVGRGQKPRRVRNFEQFLYRL